MKNRVRTVRYFVEFWCDACASSFWITREREMERRHLEREAIKDK